MPFGTVKFFNDPKGYGFFTVDGSTGEVFFHARDLRACDFGKEPVKGERIEFEIGHGNKGVKAINVKRVA